MPILTTMQRITHQSDDRKRCNQEKALLHETVGRQNSTLSAPDFKLVGVMKRSLSAQNARLSTTKLCQRNTDATNLLNATPETDSTHHALPPREPDPPIAH